MSASFSTPLYYLFPHPVSKQMLVCLEYNKNTLVLILALADAFNQYSISKYGYVYTLLNMSVFLPNWESMR